MRFLRNRIRRQLIPALEKSYNPGLIDTLNRLANIVRDEEKWMAETLHPIFQTCLAASEKDRLVLSVPAFENLHVALKRRIFRTAVARVKGDLRHIHFDHIDAMCALLVGGRSCKEVHLPGRIRVVRISQKIEIIKENCSLREVGRRFSETKTPAFHYTVPRPDTHPVSVMVKEVGMQLCFHKIGMKALPTTLDAGHSVAFFDMDMLRFPLVVRRFTPGDRFVPLGMSGHQKVKKFFIDRKIGRPRREKSLILADQDRIIWVVGYRMADGAKVGRACRYILKAELLLA
jgi:tRNA(Ile)-lysidine synthase